jgi:hypothetical protein
MGGFSYGGFGGPDDEQDDELRSARIARPSPSSGIPPVSLRGVGSPSPTPEAGSPIASSSPLEARTTADQNELVREQRTGSGISQIQHGSPEGGIGIAKPHPIAGGILRGLSTIGSVLAPGVMANIPGTEEHHNLLLHQQRGRIGEDLGEQKEEAATAETGARTEQASAAAEKDRADAAAAGQPKAKEEKWGEFAGFTDVDGTPLIHEENSGQVLRASDKKPPTGFQAAKPAVDKQDPTTKVTRVINGVPHEVLVNGRTGEDIKDEGQTKVPGESPETKRNAAESAQVEREARQNIRKASDQYRATQQSVNQLTASIDAAKDGNGLLTSFVPTMEVLGINASNGVHRISPAEAQAAGLPGGWVERFNAWFDKATTGKLSPELQQEGKALGKILSDSAYQRYKSTYDDESGIVSGYGGTDFGKRVPLIQGGTGNTMQAGGTVTMKAPNGATKQVSADQVEHYKSLGAVVVQ